MFFLLLNIFLIFLKEIHCGGPSASSQIPLPNSCVILKTGDLTQPDGSYIKTACKINYSFNYDRLYNECGHEGMNLLKLSDESTYNAFIKLLEDFGLTGTSTEIFVNGQKDEDGNWILQPGNEPLYSGVKWVGDQSEDCLVVAYLNDEWGLASRNCEDPSSGYCQFNYFKEEDFAPLSSSSDLNYSD